MWFKDANVLICGHWCLSWCGRDQTIIRIRTIRRWSRWVVPAFFLYDVYVLKWFTYDDLLLNPCWMMKRWWSVWLNSRWLLKWLWNVDRVLDECWNNDENVNVLKWPIWSGYIIVLRWILTDYKMLIGLLWIRVADEWLYKYYEGPTVVFYWV